MGEQRQKNSPLIWLVFAVVCIVAFISIVGMFDLEVYEGLQDTFGEGGTIFQSKRERIAKECKQTSFERAESTRDTNLKVLKAKSKPTEYDLEEIERLEIWQREGVVSRDDNDYFYKDCMKVYGY